MRIANDIRSGLAAIHVELRPDAMLSHMLADAEWLGTGPEDLFGADTRMDEDADRFARAFMRMEQADRLSNLLHWAKNVGNLQTHSRRWIQKRIDRTETQVEEAQDLLFEVEIAGRLARWPGMQIELAEPDILIRYPADSEPLALACKRPRSENSLERAIRDAKRQILAAGYEGIILVGTEALFHMPADSSGPVTFKAETPAEARSAGEERTRQIMAAFSASAKWLWANRIGGVYFVGILTYWSARPSSYGYAWIRDSLPNPTLGGASAALQRLDWLLFNQPDAGQPPA